MKPHVNVGTIGRRPLVIAPLLAMAAAAWPTCSVAKSSFTPPHPQPEPDKYQQDRIAAAEAKRQRKALKRNSK